MPLAGGYCFDTGVQQIKSTNINTARMQASFTGFSPLSVPDAVIPAIVNSEASCCAIISRVGDSLPRVFLALVRYCMDFRMWSMSTDTWAPEALFVKMIEGGSAASRGWN